MPSHSIRAVSAQQASPDPSNLHRSFSAEAGPALSHNKPSTHKPHRPHVVVSHRPHTHVRNPSLKNINRLQRLAAAHNLPGEGDTNVAPALRHHQRKKSAPSSPSSPLPGRSHVRWNGSTISLSGQGNNPAIRKNFSTPALRNTSGILLKKPSAMTKTGAVDKTGQKKTVGFELAASDDDEWEDNNSSYSPESTRRNSVVTAKMSADNNPHTPLQVTKSPLAQPNSDLEGESGPQTAPLTNGSGAEESQEQHVRPPDQDDIASRLIHQPHSSKVPPTISSVSAIATPPAVERSPIPPSFPTLPSGRIRDLDQSGTWSAVGSASTNNPHGTSSSIEGGVSRFLINNPSSQPGVISESDPPSSFLPHYHPNTPPSPETNISKRPTSRGRQEPPSRTQQKLWLQRTAVLTTSPPDSSMSGPSPTAPPSSMDPAFMATAQSRPGSRDGRRIMISAGGAGGANPESEAKRARKTYDKFTTEYSVVRRFRGPIAESFLRLEKMTGADTKSNNPPPGQGLASGQNPVGFSGALSRPSSSRNLESDPAVNHQFISKLPKSSSQARLRTSEDIVPVKDSDEPVERLDVEHQQQQQQRPNSVAVVLADGNMYDEQIDDEYGGGGDGHVLYQPNEAELLIRRMWDSREVAVAGD
ncbi:hypothetical protein ACJ72_05650 [Emergomyces africanus]|uniref:Uncharacterized protein n=1 Tax=Emergomyces africanus TaxID=1955775 RepID=A0A1B7NTB0_9EURO|nr:hypothetical protein ACJ72_05650 [Emergomyces africanus]